MAENETPSQDISTSLWSRVQSFYDGMWGRFFKTPPEITNPLFSGLAAMFADKIEGVVAANMVTALEQQLKIWEIPDDIAGTINKVIADRSAGSILLGYLFLVVYFASTITAHTSISGLKTSQKWNQVYTPTIPDVMTLIVNLFRNPESKEAITALLSKHGYNQENIDLMLTGNKTILDPNQIRQLFLRQDIDVETHDRLLGFFGYSKEDIIKLKELYYPIPSYPDLINMAVREAFQPDYVEEFNLLAEFPGEFKEWAGKQGLSEEWAKKYWSSHWVLPSILQAYEMLHRDVITDTDLESLFMAQDVMPWWREKLKAISYNPLTRVDVRRVFRMGIISQDQVKRTYLDLGYDEQKATWLTSFTVMETLEKERDLTKAEVLSSYSKKIITQESCVTLLTELGYSPEEIGVLIANKDYSEHQRVKKLTITRIKKMYLAGVYDHTQAVSELGRLDLPGAEQSALIDEWDAEKLSKLRDLTKKEYDGLFQHGIITEKEYIAELKEAGYIDKHIGWSLQLLKATPPEA